MFRYSLILLTLTLALPRCAKPLERTGKDGEKAVAAEGSKPSDAKSDAPSKGKTDPNTSNGKGSDENENKDPSGPGPITPTPSDPDSENTTPVIDDPDAAPTKEFGALNEPLATSGFISGYAGVQGKADEYLTVKFYLDGDNKRGKSLGAIRANLVAFDNGLDGDHGFIYDLPRDALDGRVHKLHIYVVWNGKEYPISEKKPVYDIRGFTPKGEAVATAFAKTGFMVNGRVNPSCRGCHGGFSYQDRWTRLTEESPDTNEWTAEKNYLINKLRRGHIDSRRIAPCSVIKCDEVINWWKQEFGGR